MHMCGWWNGCVCTWSQCDHNSIDARFANMLKVHFELLHQSSTFQKQQGNSRREIVRVQFIIRFIVTRYSIDA